jgi:hypothetical protein
VSRLLEVHSALHGGSKAIAPGASYRRANAPCCGEWALAELEITRKRSAVSIPIR